MKNKIIIPVILLVMALAGCSNGGKQQPGMDRSFKYTAYSWNDSKDSFGIRLKHYLEILPDGNYKLILRNMQGGATYYYGYVDNGLKEKIVEFNKNAAANYVMPADTAHVPYHVFQYYFDNSATGAEQKLLFTDANAAAAAKDLKQRLDSLINAPGKKQSASFNINSYIEDIIAHHPQPK